MPAAAGLAAGFAFVALFSAWAANPPLYRIDSWIVYAVKIPEGAAAQERNFEPEVIDMKSGSAIRWTNNETAPTTVVIGPACTPSSDVYKATTASRVKLEKQLAPGESFECRFNDMGEYTIHAEPWPWMRGTIKVAP
ncbi:plastocyanin [Candidatus Nitrososphaera evergladensis SR1]|jgi:plastocyanin|uniref:Plastocyanin n=1 Tax=Candidatus Nitrososphaera evergladensis SR1 TaxID=1459636 RepID=A0A075MQH1_9ARCH|nr:plastocyanin/azurin family copper-binding protein [Candidatus Nitrososphaera evergladensis]AIF83122.1 plastocyanin [Candidatus Nitrososphaera evergladensis SR1]